MGNYHHHPWNVKLLLRHRMIFRWSSDDIGSIVFEMLESRLSTAFDLVNSSSIERKIIIYSFLFFCGASCFAPWFIFLSLSLSFFLLLVCQSETKMIEFVCFFISSIKIAHAHLVDISPDITDLMALSLFLSSMTPSDHDKSAFLCSPFWSKRAKVSVLTRLVVDLLCVRLFVGVWSFETKKWRSHKRQKSSSLLSIWHLPHS